MARYVHATLDQLDTLSLRGFAFNVLTSRVDFRRPDLYYADPAEYAAFCEMRYAGRVTVLQDYGLYEFTLIVSK